MNRIYECMVLLDNREVRQGWDALKESVTGLMTKHGAEIVSAKFWEERKLAYQINGQQRGTYMLVYFNAPTSSIDAMNREFNMAETVMRHMVTACEALPEDVNEPEKEFDVEKIGIEEEKPEPEPEKAEEKSEEEAPAEEASDAEAQPEAAASAGEEKE